MSTYEIDAPLYIYGCGKIGYRVADFLSKCSIGYEGFIDVEGDIDCFQTIVGKKQKVFNLQEVTNLGKPIKIIIAVADVWGAYGLLVTKFQQIDATCLLPVYEGFIQKDVMIGINHMLGFFRSKFLTKPLPSIISNSCNAGLIYNFLGVKRNGHTCMLSPTINNIIEPYDFLKICHTPRHYLGMDIKASHWTIFRGHKCPVGVIDDVEVVFIHDNDMSKAVDRWNNLRVQVDYDNLCFIMEDYGKMPITFSVAEQFCNLDYKKLLLLRDVFYDGLNDVVCLHHGNFHERNIVIEDWFDLVEWING